MRDMSRQPMAWVSVRVNKVLVSNQRSSAPASRIDKCKGLSGMLVFTDLEQSQDLFST